MGASKGDKPIGALTTLSRAQFDFKSLSFTTATSNPETQAIAAVVAIEGSKPVSAPMTSSQAQLDSNPNCSSTTLNSEP